MGGHPVEAKKRFSIQCVDHRALQIELFLRARSVGALAVASALLLTCLSAQSASAQTFKTLYTFCQESGCKDGKLPKGGVAINAAGNLYGTTGAGGASGDGVIFTISSKDKFSVLHSFTGTKTDGSGPTNVSPVFDKAGDVYGVTAYGGAGTCKTSTTTGCGTVFKITSAGKESVFHSFTGSPDDGYGPDGGLVIDAAGDLYGTTLAGGIANSACSGGAGCGTVFKITSAGKESVVYRFCSKADCADGAAPQGGLRVDTEGNLYGTTSGGGTHSHGTVFKLTATGVETVLYDLCAKSKCTDGETPFGGLALDTKGNLYGTTGAGGSAGYGTLFTITTSGKNFSILHSFAGPPADGAEPVGRIAIDSSGNVFGTTLAGGASVEYGTVFEYNKGSGEKLLHSFDGSDGSQPYGTILDVKGVLYGTTSAAIGTVFQVTP
jgi:uncharacterized repeat protein (TIGR03803 family)